MRQWLAKAESDLQTAQHLAGARPDLAFAIAFHAQQAAEKLIKAALVWRQVEFPKTHDIDRLVELLCESDMALGERLRETCSLTPYGVDARYPGDLPEPSAIEARDAVGIAERTQQAILESLPSFLRPARGGA